MAEEEAAREVRLAEEGGTAKKGGIAVPPAKKGLINLAAFGIQVAVLGRARTHTHARSQHCGTPDSTNGSIRVELELLLLRACCCCCMTNLRVARAAECPHARAKFHDAQVNI